jgi:hypothetical protein
MDNPRDEERRCSMRLSSSTLEDQPMLIIPEAGCPPPTWLEAEFCGHKQQL